MPVDVLILKPENRRKQALVADMESTIIRNEMLDEMAYEAEIGEQVAEITRRAMNGELDFYEAIRERVGLLKEIGRASVRERVCQYVSISGVAESIKKKK